MLTYLLRRLAILVLSLLIAAVVLFVLLRLLPGDPANALLGVGATESQIAAARAPGRLRPAAGRAVRHLPRQPRPLRPRPVLRQQGRRARGDRPTG